MERCLSGRKERFAKSSYGLHCTVGSNPTLSAEKIKNFPFHAGYQGSFLLNSVIDLTLITETILLLSIP